MGGTLKAIYDSLCWCVPESRTSQAILIGAVIGLAVYLLTKKRYRWPPGPRGLPLIGNLLAIRKDPLYLKVLEWQKTYGPVMTIGMGPLPCVILNRIDFIQEAFLKKSVDFAGRPQLFSLMALSEGGKDIVFTNYGPAWQLHRRLAIKALNFYMKGNKFEETVEEATEIVLKDIRTFKEPFDLQDYMKLVVFNILALICFNESFTFENEEFKQFAANLDTATNEFGNGVWEDIIPPLRYCPTPKYREMVKIIKESLDFFYIRVNQHRASFTAGHERDFTDAMLLAQKEAQAVENPELLEQITDTHITQTVSDIFQAGVDTSRQTLYWTLLYMCAYPDLQAKAQEELDQVLGDRTHVVMSDRDRLPFTLAVLYETMRIAPIAPLGLPHTTLQDTTIGDYDVPKGTMVMANIYATHTDPNFWDKPYEFRPQRFLDSDGKMTPKKEQWMPFSIGKRSCLAEALAKPELHLILATLLKNLEFRLPEGVTADLQPEVTGFACIPKPYKVLVKDRIK